ANDDATRTKAHNGDETNATELTRTTTATSVRAALRRIGLLAHPRHRAIYRAASSATARAESRALLCSRPALLLLLHHDPAISDEYTVAVSILAGGDVVVVALLGGADHLPARLTLQDDDRRQIPEHRWVLLGRCGSSDHSHDQQQCGKDLFPMPHSLLQASRRVEADPSVLNFTGSARRFHSASFDEKTSRASGASLS